MHIDAYQSLADAAARNSVTTGRMRQLCIAGAVPDARKIGGVWLVPKAYTVPGTAGGRPAKPPVKKPAGSKFS